MHKLVILPAWERALSRPGSRPPAILATVVTALVGAAGFVVAGPGTPPASAAIGGLTWSDEFNAAAGTPPASSGWRYDIGGGGWGNNEL